MSTSDGGRPRHHLAQVNIALPREPLESELLAPFVALLDEVNGRADRAPGFVWRLQDDEGNATGFDVARDDRMIVNLSVWESLEALRAFVYADAEHLAAVRRRREWFEKLDLVLALWWLPAGELPDVPEAERRLRLLEERGPTEEAFTFRQLFAPPASLAAAD